METESQKRANSKWKKNHSYKNRIYTYRSTAHLFIKHYATMHDIKVLTALLRHRAKYLSNE